MLSSWPPPISSFWQALALIFVLCFGQQHLFGPTLANGVLLLKLTQTNISKNSIKINNI
jgi:hypothetical protein